MADETAGGALDATRRSALPPGAEPTAVAGRGPELGPAPAAIAASVLRPRRPTGLKRLFSSAGFTAAAFLAFLLARVVTGTDEVHPVVWPASGIAFAAAWRYGARAAVLVALGAMLWMLAIGASIPALGAAALSTAAGGCVATALLRRINEWSPVRGRMSAAVRLVLAIVCVAAPVEALIRTLALTLAPQAGAWGATPALALLTGAPWQPGIPVDPFVVVTPFAGATTELAASAPAVWLGAFAQHALATAAGILVVAPAVLTWLTPAVSTHTPDAASRGQPAVGNVAPSLMSRAGHSPFSYMFGFIAVGSVSGLAATQQLPTPWSDPVLMALPAIGLALAMALRLDERAQAFVLLPGSFFLLLVQTWSIGPDAGYDPRLATACILLTCAAVCLILQGAVADRMWTLQRLELESGLDGPTRLLNDRSHATAMAALLTEPRHCPLAVLAVELPGLVEMQGSLGTVETIRCEQFVAETLRAVTGLRLAARTGLASYRLAFDAPALAEVRLQARAVYQALKDTMAGLDESFQGLQPRVAALLVEPSAAASVDDCAALLDEALQMASDARSPHLFVETLSADWVAARRRQEADTREVREAVAWGRLELYAEAVNEPAAPVGQSVLQLSTRLRTADGELKVPAAIPASATGLAHALDRRILRAAFEWLSAHPVQSQGIWRCFIRLSRASMLDSLSSAHIAELREAHGVPAARIVFEFSHADVLRHPAASARLFEELSSMGFRLALSGLSLHAAGLQRPRLAQVDYVVIEAQPQATGGPDPIDEEGLHAVVGIARRLGIRTLARQVRDPARGRHLRTLGVDALQGELVCLPVPLGAFFKRPLQTTADPLTV